MMINNNMGHAISSSPSFSNCRQTAAKLHVNLSSRRRADLRRLKVLSTGDESLLKRRRFENVDHDVDQEFAQYSCVIGRRREMEDAISVELGFLNNSNNNNDNDNDNSDNDKGNDKEKGNDKDTESRKFDFFGVYDGHGGSRVAYACRERLHKLLAEEMRVVKGCMNWEKVMGESFVKMDEEVNESDAVGSMGSTAIVAVVSDEEIVVANCGDSRAVLSRDGATVPLSNDHKPDRPDELERIERSGGTVINWNGNRVLGVLATSRSIGDRQLKPYVIAKPEVTVSKREDGDEFMILASDGLWDVISNDFACNIVRKCLHGKISYRKRSQQMNENNYRMTNAATVLTELAMARGSKDNISVIVVNLKN